jgi:hypothetical protein
VTTTVGPGARVAVFVDHSNFYNGLKQQSPETGGKYDFLGLVREITRGRTLIAWGHYSGMPDPALQPDLAERQQVFVSYLERTAARERIPLLLRTQLLFYPPGYPRCGRDRKPTEKGIDARIVQDLIVGAFDKAYDVAVLLSGDRDFCNVVEFLKMRFPDIRLETLFANTRRHLFDLKTQCFDEGRVIDRHILKRIIPRR